MEKEIFITQFEQIETKINSLIEICNQLEIENAELKEKNSQLESDINELRNKAEQNDEVKILVKSKIDSLMERLNNIAESHTYNYETGQ